MASVSAEHAARSCRSFLVDVGNGDVVPFDAIPNILLRPYRKRMRCASVPFSVTEYVATATLQVIRSALVAFVAHDSEDRCKSRSGFERISRFFLQLVATFLAYPIRLVDEPLPLFGNTTPIACRYQPKRTAGTDGFGIELDVLDDAARFLADKRKSVLGHYFLWLQFRMNYLYITPPLF